MEIEAVEVIETLEGIDNVEKQMETLEPIIVGLDEDHDAVSRELAEALLSMMERCASDDDFGLFSTIECILDDHEDRDELIRASVLRQPMWKTIEMIGESPEDLEVLRQVSLGEHDEDTQMALEDAINDRQED